MMAASAYQGQGEFELEPADGRSAPQLGRNNDRPVAQTGIGGGPPNPARAAAATESPAVVLMRVNCRLTLLLREMVFIERGLRPVTEVVSQTEQDEEDAKLLAEAEEELERMKRRSTAGTSPQRTSTTQSKTTNDEYEYSSGILDADNARNSRWSGAEWRTRQRNVAARALYAYVSALTSHPVGLRAFAAAAVDGYVAGIPARESPPRSPRRNSTSREAGGDVRVAATPPGSSPSLSPPRTSSRSRTRATGGRGRVPERLRPRRLRVGAGAG